MRIIHEDTIQQEFENITQNRLEYVLGFVSTHTLVAFGNDKGLDVQYMIDNNIPYWYTNNFGATIIKSAGDFGVAVTKVDGWNEGQRYINLVKDYLISKGINASVDNNDLMIDGQYKVGSFGSINLGDNYIYTAFHFSINVDLDLIKRICTKPMVKIPKGLSEYGITYQEIEQVFDENKGE